MKHKRQRVILITDSRVVNRIIREGLGQERFEVTELSSGTPELLEGLDAGKPDLIFLRTVLENADGFKLCEAIKVRPALAGSRVVFISSDEHRGGEAIGRRASRFLHTPFTREELLRAVESDRAKTILFTDDSKVQHRAIVPALVHEGYRVLEAWDGQEALDLLEDGEVDLLISDVEMPVLDGFELCKRVKSDPETAGLPVLIASSLDSESAVGRGFAAGADDYITKPIVVPELLARVSRMLGAGSAGRPERILVMDPTEAVRALVVRALRSHGFQVDESSVGDAALELAGGPGCSLAVVGYETSSEDECAWCLQLRQGERTGELPIILLGGRDSRADLVKIRSVGVQAFIAKPFNADRLLAEVERILAEARLRKQRDLMRHYLSSDAIGAIDRLAATTAATETRVEDQFRTVLFSDIVGFTPLCERRSPGEVVDILNGYFDRMVEILIGYDAIIDKFIGDAVLAMFGRQEDGAHRAIAAGLDMVRALPELSAKLGVQLHIRVGINSGHVIVGDIGSRLHRRDHSVIGDTVNVAQRFESAARTDTVLIGARTLELIKDRVEVEVREALRLKGKELPLSAYQVNSVKPYLARTRSQEGS